MKNKEEKLYQERAKRCEDAINLKEPDRVPICPAIGIIPYALDGCTNKESMYNYERATEAIVHFYQRYPMMDGAMHSGFRSGKANELAGSTMIDWPGRPGTKVPDQSTFQVMEFEYMKEDEYQEILQDFTGFMLRKYIPRAYPNLAGLSSIRFIPDEILGTTPLAGLYTPEVLKTYQLLGEIAKNSFEFRINCSSGTYIRSIARDMAKSLNTLGYMKYIIRERSGSISLNDCVTLEEFEKEPVKYVLSFEKLLPLKRYALQTDMAQKALNGLVLNSLEDMPKGDFYLETDGEIKAVCEAIKGKLVLKTRI